MRCGLTALLIAVSISANAQCVRPQNGDSVTLIASFRWSGSSNLRVDVDAPLCDWSASILGADRGNALWGSLARKYHRAVITGFVVVTSGSVVFHPLQFFEAPADPRLLEKTMRFDEAVSSASRCIAKADEVIAREQAIGREVGIFNSQQLYAAGQQKVVCRERIERLTSGGCKPWDCETK